MLHSIPEASLEYFANIDKVLQSTYLRKRNPLLRRQKIPMPTVLAKQVAKTQKRDPLTRGREGMLLRLEAIDI